jgi:carboxypeptidase Taq
MTRIHWEKERRVPTELAAELAAFESKHVPVWLEARERNDFRLFAPSLQRGVDLCCRLVDCYEPTASPYDVLLDRYDMGLDTAEIASLFATVRDGLKPLIKQVVEHADAVSDAPVRDYYPVDGQRALARELVEGLGFEADSWRLDETVHPFEISLSISDIRLTTKYKEHDLAHAIGGAIHEFGHGLYERQSDPALEGLPIAGGASSALHESQSRTWEILVGGRRSFWRWAYPIYARHFPEQAATYDEEAIYRAFNKMAPSLIRTEADQLTYGMHIILRFELEQELLSGSLAVRDVAEAWSAKMRDYLGVEVPDDLHGVLQDIHWASGSLGGFPAYLIGNVIGSQAWTLIERDMPDVDAQIAAGQFGPLREWSASHLHRMGSRYPARETMERFLGGPIDPQPYLTYLEGRVNELYS